ncbi:MAG: bifunctional nuclease family protein [Candidatus Firestonebacteria bacterium]|nr:bifunctional nuclease family protein [Candidatus Firestonebacteria bacterium]
MNKMVSVIVQGVVMDPVNRGFAVILRDALNSKWLPIYVGPFEAQSIVLEMDNVKHARPGTHDLIKVILDNLKANVVKVNINDLRDNTFYASITVEVNGEQKEIDSRPSDAIAIALRTKAPILVAESIIDLAGKDAHPHHNMDENTKQLNNLQTKLTEVIEKENYEEAAGIRDEITRLKKTITQQNNS